MAYAERRGKTWRVRYKRPDGTWGSESGFPTKTAALAYGREQESRVRRGDWTDPKSAETRLTDFIDRYLEAVDAAPGTISKQESHIRCHILPRWGSWQLGDLVMAHMEIRAWTKELRAKYPSGTVASIFQTLTAIMDMAVEARLIPASPAGASPSAPAATKPPAGSSPPPCKCCAPRCGSTSSATAPAGAAV